MCGAENSLSWRHHIHINGQKDLLLTLHSIASHHFFMRDMVEKLGILKILKNVDCYFLWQHSIILPSQNESKIVLSSVLWNIQDKILRKGFAFSTQTKSFNYFFLKIISTVIIVNWCYAASAPLKPTVSYPSPRRYIMEVCSSIKLRATQTASQQVCIFSMLNPSAWRSSHGPIYHTWNKNVLAGLSVTFVERHSF